ncbi:MAG TPA: hypothetical protein DCQ29_07980 [Chitinophagaceae bacterium]|nr:hypothetical protein [Chitinophagaceae bacterium]
MLNNNNMKIAITLLACIGVQQLQAQSNSIFNAYQNDTLLSSDAALKEQPTMKVSSKAVLDASIKWHNPYDKVANTNTKNIAFEKFGKVAPKGVYPRLFTSPSEFTTIQQQWQNTKIGKQLLQLATVELSKLVSGQGVMGKAYKQLQTTDTVSLPTNFPYNDFANQLAIQGLLAQVQQQDSVFTLTGKIAGNFLQVWMRYIDNIKEVEGKDGMVKEQLYNGAKIAKLFDFTATAIPKEQRKAYIAFMLKNTTNHYSDGMQLPPHWRRWNHIAMALAYPLATLSLEHEKGFDKRIYDRGLEVLQDYLTYTFSPEGMSTEGITYTFNAFPDDLLLMIAAAKRGKTDFWAHPHFRNISDWLIYALAPNPNALWWSYGDTGSASELNWLMMMLMKYFLPTDEKVDYLFANALPKSIDKLPDVSAFVFAIDPDKTREQYAGIPPITMPLTYFSASRGSFTARNKWNKQAVRMQFEARHDTYFQSHDHADRGAFTLAAHGRMWVVDGWRSTESKYHSVITIDGRGQGYFATPASWINYVDNAAATFAVIDQKYTYDWMWLKSPVADMMLGKPVAKQWQQGVYADAANNLRKYYPTAIPQRDPLKKVANYFSKNLATNPLIWTEDTWPMRIPNYEVAHAFRTAGLVKGKHDYVLIIDDIKKDDTEKLYEWLLPMPLDVEVVTIKQLVDIKQESGPLNIGFNTLSNQGIQGDYDILLGDKRMKRNMQEVDETANETHRAGRFMPQRNDPQLLVRILNHTPAPRPNLEPNPRLETLEKLKTEDMHQFYLRTMDLGKRLVIPSRSNSPAFKVLLFPHLSGEELPQTKWNNDRTILEVRFKDQVDTFYFASTPEGRTKVKLVRDGNVIFDL